MKKIYMTVALALIAAATYSQDLRLGKVSKEELMEKAHPADISAAAAVLYKSGKTYFEYTDSFNVIHEIEYRIKIYKKEGYQYATDENYFYTGGEKIRAYYTDAYTYNLVGDKIEKTKLKSDGEFLEKKNENYSIKKITMPNVKEGSIIEYKYVVRTPYLGIFDDFYFQYDIPVNNVRYEIATPIYYNYSRYMKGYVDIAKTPVTKRKGAGGLFDENFIIFSAKDVKALKDESYVNNINNYRSVLSHELSSTDFPSEPMKYFSTNWETVADYIYKSDDFGKELNYTSYFEEDINALLKTVQPIQRQRLDAIFGYIQNRMTWTEQNGYFCRKGVKKAYTEKTGNVAEINLMLIAMLRHAGLDANPVLISTRANGIALFPSRGAYNYVIAAVELDGEQLLLDATSKNMLVNMLPLRAINWNGRLIKKNGATREIEVMPKKASKDVVNIAAEIDADGTIKGKARDQYFDYNAYIVRESYDVTNTDKNIQRLEKKHKGLEVSNFNATNVKELSKPVIEEYSFTHNGLADVIGDKIYISPMLFFATTENPFKLDKREFPVDFGFPNQDKYLISLKIPEGYMIESAPKSIALAMEDNIGSFKYMIEAKNNQISLIVNHDINHADISAQYYQTLKDFYHKIVEKQNEKVVLKKI